MNLFDTGPMALSAIRRLTDLWRAGRSESLIDYTRPLRVEPIVLIDNKCVYSQHISHIQQSLLHQFAAFYLLGVSLSATVGRVEVFRALDKLNPNRSPMDSITDSSGWLLAQESYKHALPMPGKKLSMEALVDTSEPEGEFSAQHGRDVGKELRELADLSVGKVINVEITDGQNRATIPIAIRLMASSIPSDGVVHILGAGSEDTSVKARWHDWRSGRLKFWRDLVFCTDLIDSHRKNLMRDESGILSNMLRRSRGNALSAILSANPSVSTASNLAVISSVTAEELEMKMGGKLKDFKTREKIFDKTYMMIMAVLDESWGRVTFYYRGINGRTEVSVSDLKAAQKNNGPDVAEILKAYQMSSTPSF